MHLAYQGMGCHKQHTTIREQDRARAVRKPEPQQPRHPGSPTPHEMATRYSAPPPAPPPATQTPEQPRTGWDNIHVFTFLPISGAAFVASYILADHWQNALGIWLWTMFAELAAIGYLIAALVVASKTIWPFDAGSPLPHRNNPVWLNRLAIMAICSLFYSACFWLSALNLLG